MPQSFIARFSLDGTPTNRTVLASGVSSFVPTPNNTAFFVSGTTSGNIDFETPDSPIACLANSLDLSITKSITPGQLLTIFGDRLGASAAGVAPVNSRYPTSAAGVQVTVGGVPAPLLYVSPRQINLQVPFEIANQSQPALQVTATDIEGFPVSDNRPLNVANVNPHFCKSRTSLAIASAVILARRKHTP